MASLLPTFPRLVFSVIEPISLVAGFLGVVIDPAWFIAEQIPNAGVVPVNDNNMLVAWQLGNLYLLMAFMGIGILCTTSEAKVVRGYLTALWLGDIGHVAFTAYALGLETLKRPQEWNAMTRGNITFTKYLRPQFGSRDVASVGTRLDVIASNHLTMSDQARKRRAAAQKSAYADKQKRTKTQASAQPEDDGDSNVTMTYLEHRRNAPHASHAFSILAPATSEAADSSPEPTQTTLADPAESSAMQDSGDEFEIQVNTAPQDEEGLFVDDERQSSSAVDMEEEFVDEEAGKVQESEEADLESKQVAFEELADQCHKLVEVFRSSDNGGHSKRLELRRELFDLFQGRVCGKQSYFVDIDKVGDIGLNPRTVAAELGRVNLACTLDLLHMIQHWHEAPSAKPKEEESSISIYLAHVDVNFARLFQPFGSFGDLERENTMLHLNIRTMLVVEVMADRPDVGAIQLVAQYFFDIEDATHLTQDNYDSLLTGSPLIDLSSKHGDTNDTLMKLVIPRIVDIVSTAEEAEDANQDRAEALRVKYDRDKFIPEIRKWVLDTYDLSRSQSRSVEDRILDEAENLDSQSEITVSHRQWRDVGDERPTLFDTQAQTSNILSSPVRAAGDSYPSPRRAVDVLTDVDIIGRPPASVVDDEDEDLFETDVRLPPANHVDDDDEDPYETDSRRPNPDRSAIVKTQLRSLPMASASMPPPPAPSQRPPPPPPPRSFPSSSASAHSSQRSPFGQRTRWNEKETAILVELVAKHQASWAAIKEDIEENYREEFQPRRNHQGGWNLQGACRDKARNLKKEYLLTDTLLPPGFDLVALTQPLEDKIKKEGKNPYRREEHVDGDHNPINTDLAAAYAFETRWGSRR
ncbi:uncharacterized protein J7T54_002758 [Emericellopsis cladophorae]|uniref:DUF7704 domain-containing protein n=1 Tax=Emericellopsis cladophorae TaxID=2686198 RepID=A0A9Q0BAU2_9HYPO|nr:uncharacterized protein J7T54_002758 [Emericellopsis cladophorae]KAI6777860.1 hypothetical protein J7T54_002758 [Emericellopsis cladophorae]